MSKFFEPFGFLYNVDSQDQDVFGYQYQPEHQKFEHGKPMKVGYLPQEEDGQNVTIFETRYPARFFELHAEASPDRSFPNLGKVAGKPAVVISTGSGEEMGKLIFQIGRAIASGMLGVRVK